MDFKRDLDSDRLKLVLDNMLDAVVTVDQMQRVIQWNRQAEVLFGYTHDEAIGQFLPDLIIPEAFRDMHNVGFRRFVAGDGSAAPMLNRRVQVIAQKKGGHEFPIELSVTAIEVRGSDTERWIFNAAIRDMTHEVETEEIVARQRRLVEDFIQNVSVGLHWSDEHGIIVWANNAELQLMGYSAEEYIGKSIFDLLVDGEQFREQFKEVKHMEFKDVPIRVRRKDGTLLHMLASSNALIEDGKFVHTRAIWRDVTAQREVEERFRATFEQAAVGIVHLEATVPGQDPVLLRSNQKMADMLGYTVEELRGLKTQEICHPDDLDIGQEYGPKLISGEIDAATFTKRYFKKGGEMVWLDFTVSAVRHDDGTPKYYIVVVQDVTDKRAAQAFVERQAKLLDLSPDAIFVLDAQGLVTYWNRGAADLYGIAPEAAIGQTPDALLHTVFPPDWSRERCLDYAMTHDHWEGELTQYACSGQKICVLSRWAIERDAKGEPVRLLESNTDISARKHYEHVLRESEAKFKATFEQAAVGIAHVNLDGHFVMVNERLAVMLGYTQAELQTKTFMEITYPDDMQADWDEYQSVLRGERDTYSIEKRYVHRDGHFIWVSLTASAVRDEERVPLYFISVVEEITSRRLAEERTTFLANHDALTGLANRAYFTAWLHDALVDAERTHLSVAVLVLDLDKFKFINDNYGHHVGDLLLKEVSTRLQNCVRKTDLVARMGGDEFTIVLTHLVDRSDVETIAQKITESIGVPFYLDGKTIRTAVSIGITLYPLDDQNASQLLKNADMAMYKAKMSGRNSYRFYMREMQDEFYTKRMQERQLHRAFADNDFKLVYQPQVDVATGQIVGVETLLRCTNANLAHLSTYDIVAMAEETGLIVPIGEWVLREACRQHRQWMDMGVAPFAIAVNVSPRQFHDPEFLDTLNRVVNETGVRTSCLEVEITEGMLMENSKGNAGLLHRIKELGVKVSVDDFGAGYSSLGYLKNFPVDVLKIDKMFIDGLPNDRHNIAICCAILSLCNKLEIQVIAEGVEQPDQFNFLKKEGCDTVQGWLFSKAIEAPELTQYLTDHKDGLSLDFV